MLLITATGYSQIDLTVNVINGLTLKPVAGEKVTLENKDIGYKFVLESNSQGHTIFNSLNISGSYSISISGEKYFSEIINNIELRSNERPTVQLVVTEKKSSELKGITIYSGASKINTVNAEVSAQLKEQNWKLCRSREETSPGHCIGYRMSHKPQAFILKHPM